MTGRSFTSSSKRWRRQFEILRPRGSLGTAFRHLPRGAVWSAVLALIVHLAGARLMDQPMASPRLRAKVGALTAQGRPSLILAGDSRIRSGLVPPLVADGLGLPTSLVVNMADAACDSSAVWSAYREFSPRFADRPVLMMDVSLFSVNDDADRLVRDELLWGLGFRQRCRLVSPGRAIAATFLPEKALWTACTCRWFAPHVPFSEGGYYSEHGNEDLRKWSLADRQQAAAALESDWYGQPCVTGVRWRKLQRDLQAIIGSGAQLILLDPPYHPGFEQFTRPAVQEADRQFHQQLRELGARLGVPVLACTASRLGGADPDALFYDFVHLNRAGAEIYSRIVASQVRELADAGIVQLNAGGAVFAAARQSSR